MGEEKNADLPGNAAEHPVDGLPFVYDSYANDTRKARKFKRYGIATDNSYAIRSMRMACA